MEGLRAFVLGSVVIVVTGSEVSNGDIDIRGDRERGRHKAQKNDCAQHCRDRSLNREKSSLRKEEIRHWEVTARVQKAFLSFFSICFDFLNFWLTWREHAWVSWSVRRGRARSCEHGLHNRTAASLDVGGPGPDLDSGSRRVRASLIRDVHVSNEIELN